MLVFLLALLPSAAGSALPITVGDDGSLWFVLAPLGGFAGGLAAGVVIRLRHLAWLGFFVGVLGCAVAQVIAWLVLPTSEGTTTTLPYLVAWGCVPFVVGCCLAAAVGTRSRGDQARGGDGALWAIWHTIKFSS